MTGYKVPPEHTRFKKGQSGNLKGRPKRPPELAPSSKVNESILRVASRLVRVRDGDEVREIPALEAVQNAQLQSAVKGSSAAQRDFQNRCENAEHQRRHEVEESCERGREYIIACRTLVAIAKKNGEPEPSFYPHPDDVFIDPELGACYNGPGDAQEDEEQLWRAGLRDAALAQCCLDERRRPRTKADPAEKLSAAWLYAVLMNDLLCKRYKLSLEQMFTRQREHCRPSLRTLLKMVYQKWVSLRVPILRGTQFPTIEIFRMTLRDIDALPASRALLLQTLLVLAFFAGRTKSPEKWAVRLLRPCVQRP